MTETLLRELVEERRSLPAASMRRALRKAADLTQAELAKSVGVTPACISLWETDKRQPRGQSRDRYIEALRVLKELCQ